MVCNKSFLLSCECEACTDNAWAQQGSANAFILLCSLSVVQFNRSLRVHSESSHITISTRRQDIKNTHFVAFYILLNVPLFFRSQYVIRFKVDIIMVLSSNNGEQLIIIIFTTRMHLVPFETWQKKTKKRLTLTIISTINISIIPLTMKNQ